jgi:hypothetical protein
MTFATLTPSESTYILRTALGALSPALGSSHPITVPRYAIHAYPTKRLKTCIELNPSWLWRLRENQGRAKFPLSLASPEIDVGYRHVHFRHMMGGWRGRFGSFGSGKLGWADWLARCHSSWASCLRHEAVGVASWPPVSALPCGLAEGGTKDIYVRGSREQPSLVLDAWILSLLYIYLMISHQSETNTLILRNCRHSKKPNIPEF